jgi:hypothetical protein
MSQWMHGPLAFAHHPCHLLLRHIEATNVRWHTDDEGRRPYGEQVFAGFHS